MSFQKTEAITSPGQELGNGFPRFLSELSNSFIASAIVTLNFTELQGENEALERLLFAIDQKEARRNDHRLRDSWLKRYSHLAYGGWWCAGLDLRTGEDSDWGCFKPYTPRTINGKLIKYEHPPQTPTRVFSLKVPLDFFSSVSSNFLGERKISDELDFWNWIKLHNIPIVITEGAKKAACLLSQGLPAIGLAGIWNFLEEGEIELKTEFRILSETAREWVVCFDKDSKWVTRNDVLRATKKLGEKLLAINPNNSVSVLHWEPEEGKGVDDLVFSMGQGRLSEIWETRLDLETYLDKYLIIKELNRPKLLAFISRYLQNDLAFNTLTQKCEYKGTPLTLSGELNFWLIEEFGVTGTTEHLISGLLYCAKKNSYSPVVKYLEQCRSTPPILIDDLATRYFGTKNPLYDVFVKKWLISAVARAIDPGCKVETVLILQGRKGIYKSTFFKILGGEFFDDSFGESIDSTKSLMVLHKSWIQEWSEFERITTNKAFNIIKSFLSRNNDCFVPPYGREAVDHPRAGVLCGTVNPTAILRDEQGHRRFWVISIPHELKKIPTHLLKKERNGIWHAAVIEYLAYAKNKDTAPVPWILTEEEELASAENNKDFEVCDEWEPIVEHHLEGLTEISIPDILLDLFDIELGRQDRLLQNRISKILTKLGWRKGKRIRVGRGNRRYLWIPVSEKEDEISN